MNKYIKWALVAVFFGLGVSASPIHVWVNGETLTHTDINSNFSHIHSLMVGGHGPRLMNSDVNASAAIAHSKMATPAVLPKLWASVTATCATPATCTIVDDSGIASITGPGATDGEYLVTFDSARATANYAAIVSMYGGTLDGTCHATAQTTTTVTVKCATASTGVALDAAFSILIMDSE